MSIAGRLAALEAKLTSGGDQVVLTFSEVGAFDSDVTGINYGGEVIERQQGESLEGLVGRAKRLHPVSRFHVLWFEYSEESRPRRREFLPDFWPTTRHKEAVQ